MVFEPIDEEFERKTSIIFAKTEFKSHELKVYIRNKKLVPELAYELKGDPQKLFVIG